MIPRRLGAFDIVHGFDEIVDLHRHQHQKQFGIGKEMLDPRNEIAKVRQRRVEPDPLKADRGLADGKGHDRSHDQRQETGGNVERQPEAADQPPENDDHRGKADERVLENRGKRHDTDKDERDPAQGAQHSGTRRHALEKRTDDRAETGHDATHEPRPDPDLPGQQGILRGPVDRTDHAKEIDEHDRRRDAVGHRRHVMALPFGHMPGQPGIDDDPGKDRHRSTGHDAPEHDFRGHLEHELADARQHDQIDQVVCEQGPERAEIIPREQFVAV